MSPRPKGYHWASCLHSLNIILGVDREEISFATDARLYPSDIAVVHAAQVLHELEGQHGALGPQGVIGAKVVPGIVLGVV